jgi:hypothetical protein
MDDSRNFEHVGIDAIENEIVVKLKYRPLAKVAQSRMLKSIQGPTCWRFENQLEGRVHLIVETLRLLDTVLRDIRSQFIDVVVGGGQDAQAEGHRSTFRLAFIRATKSRFLVSID